MPFVIIKVILTVLPLQKISKDLVKEDFVDEEDFSDRKQSKAVALLYCKYCFEKKKYKLRIF